jgi:hypothetical protein
MYSMFSRQSNQKSLQSHSRRKRESFRSRRLAIESLESRELLSAAPMTFQVVNDATTNLSYQYSARRAAFPVPSPLTRLGSSTPIATCTSTIRAADS